MEALSFFKFWKPNTSTTRKEGDPQPFSSSTQNNDPMETSVVEDEDLEEGDDSFFELELTTTADTDLENYHSNNIPKNTISTTRSSISKNNNPEESYSHRFVFEPHCSFAHNSISTKSKKTGDANSDPISKRKILPLEQPIVKPQSPISLLKSAPSFKVLAFNKSKSMARRDQETGVEVSHEGSGNFPSFGRDNSLRKHILEDPLTPGEECSKLGKYLKLIRPFYVKASRKEKKVRDFSGEVGSPSPASSPLNVDSSLRKARPGSGIKVAGKRLGKSKSASGATAGDGNGNALRSPTVAVGRRDDSMVLHLDGIQGAILHCKKSFNSSKGSSILSRFASESLHERSEFVDSPRTSSEVQFDN